MGCGDGGLEEGGGGGERGGRERDRYRERQTQWNEPCVHLTLSYRLLGTENSELHHFDLAQWCGGVRKVVSIHLLCWLRRGRVGIFFCRFSTRVMVACVCVCV